MLELTIYFLSLAHLKNLIFIKEYLGAELLSMMRFGTGSKVILFQSLYHILPFPISKFQINKNNYSANNK